MANYKPYLMRPIQHMLDASQTSLHQGVGYAGWGTQNLQLFQKSMKKMARQMLNTYSEKQETTLKIDH